MRVAEGAMNGDEGSRPRKQPRLDEGEEGANAQRGPPPSSSRPAPLKMSEFLVVELEQFYKPCPSYRLPVEIGAFSHDEQGRVRMDRSQLRYYAPPAGGARFYMDLRVGYESFVPKTKTTPLDGINPILAWIASHGECFRPRVASQTSAEGRVDATPTESTSAFKSRPDNLLTNFVTWRGMLTKLLCCPYNKETWAVAVTLFNGAIFLSEVETEEGRRREANRSEYEKQCCYWGVKFEDYMTSSEPPNPARPVVSSPTISSSSQAQVVIDRPGTVNDHRAFCCVVRTRINTHSVVMAGEVDCCDHTLSDKPPQSYVELKTSRAILTDRNKASFKRHKLLKWWAQSFLLGVPRIVCGFRDEGGIVKQLETFRTADIPKETQHDLSLWQPSVCLNFLDEVLTWIRKTVTKDDPRVVYLVEWREPFSCLSCRECPPDSGLQFLPDWFINKLPPPDQ